MIRGLAVSYGKPSTAGVGNSSAYCETIALGAFRQSVESGMSLRTGKPIFACLGHRRNGRKRWRLGDTASGKLRLWEAADGVHFELAGAKLPTLFTGVSVMLEPVRWRRKTDLLWELLEGGIRHIAILEAPEHPAYADTFLETLRATRNHVLEKQP